MKSTFNLLRSIVCIITVFISSSILAGEWSVVDQHSATSALGGDVISVDYMNNGAAVMSSGRGHVYLRETSADPWRRISPEIDGERIAIRTVIATAGSSGPLLAISDDRILQSQDVGETWTELSVEVTAGFTLAYDRITKTANSAILYAPAISVDDFAPYHVARSDDGGITWQVLANPSGIEQFEYALRKIVGAPTDAASVMAITDSSGIFLSRDAGLTWSTLDVNSGSGSVSASSAVFGATDDELLFAHEGGLIYWSNDGGLTWSNSGFLGVVGLLGTPDLLTNSLNPNDVFLFGAGVLQFDSQSNSATAFIWPNFVDTVNDLAISATGEVMTGSRVGVQVVVGQSEFQKSNLGFSDFVFSDIKVAAVGSDGSDRLYGLSEFGGIAAYDPFFQDWALRSEDIPASFFRTLDVSRNNPFRLVTATSTGVFTSSSSGFGWEDRTSGVFSSSSFQSVQFASDSQQIFADLLTGEGFVGSLDGGETWSVLLDADDYNTSCCSILDTAISPLNSMYIVKTHTDGLSAGFRSSDGGENWTSLVWPVEFQGAKLQGIELHPLEHETIYAATSRGVAMSTDLGSTWSVLLDPQQPGTPFSIESVEIDPLEPSRLYLGTTDRSLIAFDTRDGSYANLGEAPQVACFGPNSACVSTRPATSVDYNTAGRVLVALNGSLFEFFDDRDDDGLLDYQDNCASEMNVTQIDSDLDGIGNACDPDIAPETNDCVVNFLDIQAFSAAFLSQPGDANWNEDADFNGDLSVNFLDFSRMTSRFLQAPGPSGSADTCR